MWDVGLWGSKHVGKLDNGCLKMWEMGLWGPNNVGSVTLKMLCHPPPSFFVKRCSELLLLDEK